MLNLRFLNPSRFHFRIMKQFVFVLSFLFSVLAYAKDKKTVHIHRIHDQVKIDGVLNESFWKEAEQIKDFVMFKPGVNTPEPEHKRTVVKIAYDDDAIYVGAVLYDNNIDSIPKQIMGRDQFGNTDFFGIVLNPSNDQQNDFEFFVHYTGSQSDAFVNPKIGEDFSWNAVWKSQVSYTDDAWIVEMRIPYSAIRFSNQKVQTWGVNFHRNFRNTRTQYTWNFIDRTVGDIGQYHGLIEGIHDIKPPIRLSLFPYLTSYYNSTADDKYETKIGLDLKYGLTENFTLDATLVPDFGQTAFDNEALNLGPFEQRFDERRQFFTEGVELFNKGDLFYSRRVGASPLDYNSVEDKLEEGDSIIDNPNFVKTLNALKISGRTKNGLGVGFFNAITEETSATIQRRSEDGTLEKEKIVTNPTSLYNVLVLEQQFKRNSSVSFVNTNVAREGSYKDANVSSLRWNYFTKENRFKINGFVNYSHINDINDKSGYAADLAFRKSSGNIRYSIGTNVFSDTYDVNDLGIRFGNNSREIYTGGEIIQFNPNKKRLNSRIGINASTKYRYNPNVYVGNNLNVYANMTTLKFMSMGCGAGIRMGDQLDYWEPRKEGAYFRTRTEYSGDWWISSDYRKRFALDMNMSVGRQHASERDPYFVNLTVSPRFNINDHFTLVFRSSVFKNDDDAGYVNAVDDDVIFGKRDRFTVQNTIEGNYNFNAFHGIKLSFRSYWSKVDYYDNSFYALQDDGRLLDTKYTFDEDNNPNRSFNTWNMDLSYRWNFAPGSELIALYRNQLKSSDNRVEDTYFENVDRLINNNLGLAFSLRLVYYLDYLMVKKRFKRTV